MNSVSAEPHRSHMERLTIRVPEEMLEEIERIQGADDVSRSEAARQLLRRGSECDDLENERDCLQRQLAITNKRQDDVTELVEYVEKERSLSKQKAQAGALTRVKWLVWGMPADD